MLGRRKIIESALKKCEREVRRRINQIFQSKSFQWGHLVVGHCCNSPKKLVKTGFKDFAICFCFVKLEGNCSIEAMSKSSSFKNLVEQKNKILQIKKELEMANMMKISCIKV